MERGEKKDWGSKRERERESLNEYHQARVTEALVKPYSTASASVIPTPWCETVYCINAIRKSRLIFSSFPSYQRFSIVDCVFECCVALHCYVASYLVGQKKGFGYSISKSAQTYSLWDDSRSVWIRLHVYRSIGRYKSLSTLINVYWNPQKLIRVYWNLSIDPLKSITIQQSSFAIKIVIVIEVVLSLRWSHEV